MLLGKSRSEATLVFVFDDERTNRVLAGGGCGAHIGAHAAGAGACVRVALGFTIHWLFGRLRRVGMRNLAMALPELSPEARKKILRGVYLHLGWQLVEFCRMTRYTPENTRNWMRTEGLEHYLAAEARGKGCW